jgi:P-type Ca2+ transporter type 2C
MKKGDKESNNSQKEIEAKIPPYHAKSVKEIFKQFTTSEKGITNEEATKRFAEHGKNRISKSKKTPWIINLLKQFKSPLIYILVIAMAISFIFGHEIDGFVILFIIIVNALIGFFEETKAEKSIENLEKLIVSYAKVLRNNELARIPSEDLVPGDIILLEEGDKVPADARLFELKNFRTQEASLTGESLPREKSLENLSKKTDLGDRTNMVFMGTFVSSGTAKAVVVGTGDKTSIGQIATAIQKVIKPQFHFKQKIKQLSIQMAVIAFSGALLTFIIGYFFRGLEFFEIFLFTVASLVSGIPEGLPAVLAIVLAIGAKRMAKRNAIIRHLPAVETFAVATVIATDKTGTLTQNSLTIENVITSENEFHVTGEGWKPEGKFSLNNKEINPIKFLDMKKMLEISNICHKGKLVTEDSQYNIIGDPTEVSLLVLARKAGLEKESSKTKIIDDLPFNSENKFRATLVKNQTQKEIYSIGAFEKILEKSKYYCKNGRKVLMNKKIKNDFLEKASSMAKKGMRVLAVSYKEVSEKTNSISEKDISDMVVVGLVGMKDPPRRGVKEAIQKAKNAGIRVIMTTGDYKETAVAIANEIGMDSNPAGKEQQAMTQEDLEKLNDEEFGKVVKECNVFARVTPKMKLKITDFLQRQGEIVAMSGDGVNDSLALKKADIGISMGLSGTDVARESSEVVLADDNFVSIVNAVEEGKTVFRNIKRTSFFLVTNHVAEDVAIVVAISMGLKLPMIPIQLLYLNIVTDTFASISLAAEPSHNDVLKTKPIDKKEKILNKDILPFLIIAVVLMVVVTIPLFMHFLPEGIEKARTVAFVSMSMFHLIHAFNMRSIKTSIFKLGFFSNKWVIGAIAFSIVLMLAVLYTPFLAQIFEFVPLSLGEFLFITLICSSILVLGEVYKLIKFRKKQ